MFKTAFFRGFPTVWERISQTVDGPTQVDETQQVCSGFKGHDLPREGLDRDGSSEGGCTPWTEDQEDELTLVAGCRDVLRLEAAQEGSDFEDALRPVIEEADDLSQRLGEVWTDGLPAYRGMEHDYVVHDDGYVSDEGVHTNQAERLWSLLQHWLAKFRGLSKPGLEQTARTYGFLRSLNLTGAPIHGLVNCIAVNVFR